MNATLLSAVQGLSPTAQGALTGASFCTLTLPITNYRYCKVRPLAGREEEGRSTHARAQSMGAPVVVSELYKAYLPTVLRDIVYGIVRQSATRELLARYPDLPKTAGGKFLLAFFGVLASCIISAPGNEVRGYFLQPPNRRLPVAQFFQPVRFLRSTIVGALIMSTALGTGAVVTGPFQEYVSALRAWMRNNTVETIVALFALHQLLENSRNSAVIDAQAAAVKQQDKKA